MKFDANHEFGLTHGPICPQCGVSEIDGVLSHKHDCPLHQRNLDRLRKKTEKRLTKGKRRLRRKVKMFEWRQWLQENFDLEKKAIAGIIGVTVFFIILVETGVVK